MEKISAVYKITNIVTKDFYIGSSKDVKKYLLSNLQVKYIGISNENKYTFTECKR